MYAVLQMEINCAIAMEPSVSGAKVVVCTHGQTHTHTIICKKIILFVHFQTDSIFFLFLVYVLVSCDGV